jgi:hypothetical protein
LKFMGLSYDTRVRSNCGGKGTSTDPGEYTPK